MIVLHPETLSEIERAHGWYEGQREGLGDELLDVGTGSAFRAAVQGNLVARCPGNAWMGVAAKTRR